MKDQIYFELVGDRNRKNSKIHELMAQLEQEKKEIEKLDKLIAERRPQKVGAL